MKYSEKEKATLDSLSPKLNRNMIAYHETGDLFADTCEIVESAQSIAYAAVDTILVQRNWLLGKRIAIECLNENGKADYGKKTMKKLSAELKEKYGKGFDFSCITSIFISFLHFGQYSGNFTRTVSSYTFVLVFPPQIGQWIQREFFRLSFTLYTSNNGIAPR